MMKKIIIAFEGFWDDFDINNNFIVNVLKKNYAVKIIDVAINFEDRKNVEYLFYSCFSEDYLSYDCIRIFFTGENLFPDFNVCDYAIGFEIMNIGDRYIRYPLYFACYREDYYNMQSKHLFEKDKIEGKEGFCSFVVSNGGEAEDIRKIFYEKLSKYKKVDSGGRYLNNIGIPEGIHDKFAFQSKYKFSISFENSSHPGYCTEKLVQSFAAKTIPIYWGDPHVEEYFNKNAFINCNSFNDFESVICRISQIDNDIEKYLDILSQPAITNYEYTIEKYDRELEKWINNIISQPFESAFRRNRMGRVKLYTDNLMLCRDLKIKKVSEEIKKNNRITRKIIEKLKTSKH